MNTENVEATNTSAAAGAQGATVTPEKAPSKKAASPRKGGPKGQKSAKAAKPKPPGPFWTNCSRRTAHGPDPPGATDTDDRTACVETTQDGQRTAASHLRVQMTSVIRAHDLGH